MELVSTRRLGIPKTKKEAFLKLEENNIITPEMSRNMQKMIGFRNIAIYDYKKIENSIIQDVIENHLEELLDFVRSILNKE